MYVTFVMNVYFNSAVALLQFYLKPRKNQDILCMFMSN